MWNSLSLQGWCYRHQWRAAPVQSWMDNSGSCTVLGSCLWKECQAAGITDRSGSHGGLLFWWDGSSVSIKARTDVLVTPRAPGTYNRKWMGLCRGTFSLALFSGTHYDQSLSSKWKRERLRCLLCIYCNVIFNTRLSGNFMKYRFGFFCVRYKDNVTSSGCFG